MPLDSSLDVTTDRDVQFTFIVTNSGADPVDLSFSDALEADFAVLDDGSERWRFSEGRMFAQMLGSETLDPGGTATYEATWDDPDSGSYTAVATLEANETECEARAEFSV